jgi:peptidoglycan-associated lipoprotein
MITRMIGLAAAVLLLAACSNNPPPGAPGGPIGGIGSPGSFAPGSQQDLAATAGDRVFFAYDQSTISGEGQQILQRQAQWLQRYPQVSVTIEGHCDERGTREYNLALGERRAQAVKNVLVALGIPSARIQTISYGKDRPIVVGSDEAGYAQNRVGITTVNGGGPSS